MIPVTLCNPPANYKDKVRNPGEKFLKRTPTPSNIDWSRHRYWNEVHDYLYESHHGICFYSASWTPRKSSSQDLDFTSIDHYIPKSKNAKLAFEWSNFRLSRTRLNNRKGSHTDVLDPCAIQDNWFQLDFYTFLIRPSQFLSDVTKEKVKRTIERLELNKDQDYILERIEVIKRYSLSLISFGDVSKRYPFIANQIQTQDFDNKIKPNINKYFKQRR